jgi:hypothetical protein
MPRVSAYRVFARLALPYVRVPRVIGRYRLQGDFEVFWEAGMRNSDFRVLPGSVRHTAHMISLLFHQRRCGFRCIWRYERLVTPAHLAGRA